MTFTQLEVFAALAQAGSFSRAAQLLGITQSAVSHAIRALETELGVQLLSRDRAIPEITEVGKRLLLRAHEIRHHHEALRQEADNARGLATGKLRIGSFCSTSSLRLLPDLLAAFHRAHPGIEVLIDEDDDETVVQWLLDRRVEIGFVVVPDERFETVPLAQDEFVAILPSAHPLASKRAIELTCFNDEPFIRTDAGCGLYIDRMLDQAQAAPNILYRFTQLTSILGLIAQGHAVSIAARLALPDNYEGVVYKPLTPRVKRVTGLAVRDMSKLSPAAKAFLKIAQQRQMKIAS